jgi:hypothetical protein
MLINDENLLLNARAVRENWFTGGMQLCDIITLKSPVNRQYPPVFNCQCLSWGGDCGDEHGWGGWTGWGKGEAGLGRKTTEARRHGEKRPQMNTDGEQGVIIV